MVTGAALALLLAAAPGPTADQIPDFGRVSLAALLDLEGRRLRCTFRVGSLPGDLPDGGVGVEAEGAYDVVRTIWLPASVKIPEPGRIRVSGTVRVIYNPPAVHGGVWFGGFMEVRLLRAVQESD
jgi:hypothetical protein